MKNLVEDSIEFNISLFKKALKDAATESVSKDISVDLENLNIRFRVQSDNIVFDCYTSGESKHYVVRIAKTRCGTYKGERVWFQCPTCKRRSGKLYLLQGTIKLQCRVCHDMIYKSQKEADKRTSFISKDLNLLTEMLRSGNPKRISQGYKALLKIDHLEKKHLKALFESMTTLSKILRKTYIPLEYDVKL